MGKDSQAKKAPTSLAAPTPRPTIRVLPELVPANLIQELESGLSNYVSTIQSAITSDLERELLETLGAWFPNERTHLENPSFAKKLINSAISPGQSGIDRTLGALDKTKYFEREQTITKYVNFLGINALNLYGLDLNLFDSDGKSICSGCKKTIKKTRQVAETANPTLSTELKEWHLDCLATHILRELAKSYRSAKGALDKQAIAVRGILAANRSNPILKGQKKKLTEIGGSRQYEDWLQGLVFHWSKSTNVKREFHQSYESAFFEYSKAILEYSSTGTFPIEATKERLAKHLGEKQVNSVIEQFLTERQMAMLGYIKNNIEKTGQTPSMSDIGHAVGLKSPASVKYQLEMLEQKGFIRKTAVEHASAVNQSESLDDLSSKNEPDKIISVDAKEYADATLVGEAFRSGNAVLLNCSEMEEGDRKRLIDFASGLAFASHGSIERVTSKVFLITPAEAIGKRQKQKKESSPKI